MTFDEIEAEVRRLATEYPDFVYVAGGDLNRPFCIYNPTDGLCSCIFGQAMINLRYPIPLKFEGVSIHRALDNMGIKLNSEQIHWALTVQCAQDSGNYTWSESVRLGDEECAQRKRLREQYTKTWLREQYTKPRSTQ